jgi:hypothetical protein
MTPKKKKDAFSNCQIFALWPVRCTFGISWKICTF